MKIGKFSSIVFGVSFIIISLIIIVILKGTEYYTVDADYEKVSFDDCFLDMSGYKTTDYVNFEVSSEDPQLTLDFSRWSDKNFAGMVLKLENEIDLSSVEIYYGRESTDFIQNDSFMFKKAKSKDIKVLSIEGYKYLRIDIDENFTIQELLVARDYNITKNYSAINYIIGLIISFIISIIFAFSVKLDKLLNRIHKRVRKDIEKLYINRKKIIVYLGYYLLIFAATNFVELVYYKSKELEYFNVFRMLIFFVIISIIFIGIKKRKTVYRYAHLYFFYVVMLIGTIYVIASPPTVGISWDDEIHYGRSAYLSWGANGRFSSCDDKLIDGYAEIIYERNVYTKLGREKLISDFNDMYKLPYDMLNSSDYKISCSYIAYIPCSIALIIGRGIGLSYTNTFVFGKMINLLFYSLILSYSIKILKKRGKIIVSILGLIPTSLFMAASYSYDWWVISFVILGYSMFFSRIQSEERITTQQFIIIMAVMVIGILPKAIYFPLIFPMMICSCKKYRDSKVCRWVAIFAIMLLFTSFMLPMLISGAGTGDVRGGVGVNSTEQIKFILLNPIHYAKILCKFLLDYLSLDNSNLYLTYIGYCGLAKNYTLCILILGIVALFDNVEEDRTKSIGVIQEIGVYASIIVSIVLVSTALYISFTPVANETILGCQYRYLLPVLYPFIYCVGRIRIKVSDESKSRLFALCTSVMSGICLYAIYSTCIGFF